jgi:hypothetical protein
MLRIVPTYSVHAPNPVTHLSGHELLALRGFALDLSNYFVGDMSSYKQGAVSALCRGHSATTRRTTKDILPVAPVKRQSSH